VSGPLLTALVYLVVQHDGITAASLKVAVADELTEAQRAQVDAAIAMIEPAVGELSVKIAELVSGQEVVQAKRTRRARHDDPARERRN